jgi:glycosyltransferase involved in cell wall biosynthesis
MNGPRHVVLLGAVPPPYGGVQVNLMAIRDLLRRRGHRVSAINLTGNRQPDHDGLFFPRSGFGVLERLVRLRPDILHVHIGGHLPWRLLLLSLVCAGWPRAKAVLTFHSGGYPASDEGRRLTPRSLKSRVLQRFDRVIAVNDDIRSFLVRCGVAEDRVCVVSPYAGARPSAEPLPRRLEAFLVAHAPLLVTIGLLEPEYDLEVQIAILGSLLATHPRAGLVILGSGSLEGALRERLSRTPWRDHVLLHGDLAHGSTLAVLARADVFLRTTRYDGDALSVREALALGVPVVATRTALRPAGPRLVPVGDAPAIEAAIRACLAGERASFAPASRRPATLRPDGHDADHIAAVVRLYEDAIGADNRSTIRETSPAQRLQTHRR